MPASPADSSLFAWLGAKLAETRGHMAGLLQRMTGGSSPGAKPALFSKFLGMLDEVARIKGEETEIISRIEALERKHRFLRKSNKLRRADATPREKNDINFEENIRPEVEPRSFWMWVFLLW